jgi:hypothetical protein
LASREVDFEIPQGSTKLKLCFGGSKPVLVAYTDSYMAGEVDSRKSTSGYLFTYAGELCRGKASCKKCVALSSTEVEFIAAIEANKELLWLKRFMMELNFDQGKYMMFCENQSVIHLCKNASLHFKSKHVSPISLDSRCDVCKRNICGESTHR